jgi:hypothetical protein
MAGLGAVVCGCIGQGRGARYPQKGGGGGYCVAALPILQKETHGAQQRVSAAVNVTCWTPISSELAQAVCRRATHLARPDSVQWTPSVTLLYRHLPTAAPFTMVRGVQDGL